jgi:L-ascorbate metabolism protein UlaG (beta-lactamase superfamily)
VVNELVASVKWLGHASFQITGENKVIYIDLSSETKASGGADLILVTHSHPDHFDPPKIKKVSKSGTIVIAPKDCAAKLQGRSEIVKPGANLHHENIQVKAVEAYNYKRFRSPGVPFHPKGLGVGYLVTIRGKTIYHAGDTDFIPEMERLGSVDVALLPSGGKFTMDNPEAAEAAKAIKPKVAIPMHRWDTDPNLFKELVEADSDIEVKLLNEGEEYELE